MITVNTPPEILDLMMSEDTNSPTFTPERVREMARNDSVTGALCDTEVFYAPDAGINRYRDVNFGRDVLDPIRCVFDQVRAVVAEVMVGNGNVVYRPAERAVFETWRGENGFFRWVPNASDSRFCMKYTSLVSGKNVFVPEHPNLVKEKVFSLSPGMLSVAPNHIGVPSLRETEKKLSLNQRVSVLIDAMKGCSCLHKNGLIHRDIKPGNILVFNNGDDVTGKLFDHKLVVPSGYSGLRIFGTKKYMDFFWYSVKSGRTYVPTFGTDVFAFAISLIDQLYSSRGFDQCSLDQFMSYYPSFSIEKLIDNISDDAFGILDLLKAMLAKDPEDRPSLEEVIPVLQEKFLGPNCD